MEETSKDERLIRCPKCENLVQQLPHYSVYQCNSCGTFLRAKKKGNLEGDKGLERLESKENVGVIYKKTDKLLGKSDDIMGKERVFGVEYEDHRVNDNEGSFSDNAAERFRYASKKEVSIREFEIENESFGYIGNGNSRSKVSMFETQSDNGLRKSDRVFDRSVIHTREEERYGSRRGCFEEMRSSSSNYVVEGPSRYGLDSSYKREAIRATRNDNVESDREDLLRKLEELQDQLSRVQNGSNNFHEKPPRGRRMAHLDSYVEPEDYFGNHPSTFCRGSTQYSAPDKRMSGGASYGHRFEDVATHGYANSIHGSGYDPRYENMASHGYHNPIHGSSYDPRYEAPFESQMFGRPPPHRIPTHGTYMIPELDHFESRPYNTNVDHPSCSSYRRYDSQNQAPPSSFANGRFPHVKPVPYHHELHDYNSSIVSSPSLVSNESPSHKRWPSDLKLERNTRSRPQSVVLTKERHYRPVANGAPFVTCRNCFELLKLPKKVSIKMGEWQMSCAACSSIISFAIVDEKLVSVDASQIQTDTSTETVDIVNEMAHKCLKRDNGSYCSEDYANSIFDFHAMDRDFASSSTSHSLGSRKSEEMHNIHSVSATSSEHEPLADDLTNRQDYISTQALSQDGNGNLSSRFDKESLTTIKSTLGKKSLKETLATEIDISSDDYDITKLSKVASDRSQEDDQLKGKKGDSFFAGILKKSFRSNQTVESVKKNVMVNGHLIPDRLVKKAEKLAGPVSSGEYWYDYRAGFWGVIGGPCLGIVPPSIEEFNYPMPEKCAAGNTGVFVNGRELNQKDLDLLSTRGLPASRDTSYIVDITGRVTDENTGEKVVSLGKLAPTIEKVKHGFGMRAPKAAETE